ncbi:Solute carrier family 35 member F6 [Trametes pubescens]|uniref:Solute carrier family 35 member F6 n=1 Tax=Trametes pubescens TaxID=154538 RepID=A0A1M2VMQ4_TRAPU|nr:Solute carrier family 35 member F6 [Trametes pubescens]
MPSSLLVPVLVGGMLFTDMQCVENCGDDNPANHVLYEQPVWQTLQMFRFLPVIYSWARSKRQSQPLSLPADSEEEPAAGVKAEIPQQHLEGWKVLLLWFPAACDLAGTTLMNVGLLYTPVSIYQMTRGALVLFVGALSVIFLRRRLWLYQLSVSLVGLSGSMVKDAVKESAVNMFDETEPVEEPEVTKVLVGVFFILFAQVFPLPTLRTEKILTRYAVPSLVAVGYEGLFGALTIVLAMPLLARFSSVSPFFDLPRGWHQMVDTPAVLWSGVVIALSISLFNFFGLSVTRHISATARSVIDSCRTLSIWIVSLALGWEVLAWPVSLLQVAGFALLVYGTFLFNHLISPPRFLRPASSEPPAAPTEDDAETATLLAEEALEDTALLPSELGRSGFDVVPPEELARSHSRSRAATGSVPAAGEGEDRV